MSFVFFKTPKRLQGQFSSNKKHDGACRVVVAYLLEYAAWEDFPKVEKGELIVKVNEISDYNALLTVKIVRQCLETLKNKGFITIDRASQWRNNGYKIGIVHIKNSCVHEASQLSDKLSDKRNSNCQTKLSCNDSETLENTENGKDNCNSNCKTEVIQTVRTIDTKKIKEKRITTTLCQEQVKRCIEMAEIWNQRLGETHAKVNTVILAKNPSRLKSINRLIDDMGTDLIIESIDKIQASDYCNGKVNGWKPTFDWILKTEHFQKILEGNYHNDRFSKQSDTTKPMSRILV
jgi:hypothetical protein